MVRSPIWVLYNIKYNGLVILSLLFESESRPIAGEPKNVEYFDYEFCLPYLGSTNQLYPFPFPARQIRAPFL